MLIEKSDWLNENDYFLLANSAYAIDSFIMPPYYLVKSQTDEDNFNFSNQVQVLKYNVLLVKLI